MGCFGPFGCSGDSSSSFKKTERKRANNNDKNRNHCRGNDHQTKGLKGVRVFFYIKIFRVFGA